MRVKLFKKQFHYEVLIWQQRYNEPSSLRLPFSLDFVPSFVERTSANDVKLFRSVVLRDIRKRELKNCPPFEQVAPVVQNAIETIRKPLLSRVNCSNVKVFFTLFVLVPARLVIVAFKSNKRVDVIYNN